MRVTVTLYGPFKASVGESEPTVEVPEGGTVGDVLDALIDEYPELEEKIFTDGDLRDSTRITVEKTHLKNLDGMETEIDPEDELRIFQPVTGG